MLLSDRNDARRTMTPAFVRRRFADLAADAEDDRTASACEPPPGLTTAAVLVPLVTHKQEMTVIFTQRTEHLADHAGQISFPGGRVERGDSGAVGTALREAREEIGLDPDRVDVVGRLGTFDTSTGFSVTPVVGLVVPPIALTLDAFEVAEAFEVPLGFLLDRANHRLESRIHKGRLREYHAIDYQGRVIWGATARMVVDLSTVLCGP